MFLFIYFSGKHTNTRILFLVKDKTLEFYYSWRTKYVHFIHFFIVHYFIHYCFIHLIRCAHFIHCIHLITHFILERCDNTSWRDCTHLLYIHVSYHRCVSKYNAKIRNGSDPPFMFLSYHCPVVLSVLSWLEFRTTQRRYLGTQKSLYRIVWLSDTERWYDSWIAARVYAALHDSHT